MKKIRIYKNERFNYIEIKQGDKFIGYIALDKLKELLNNYDKDLEYFENMRLE